MNNKRGFTLIELVIVIAVLSILALIAIPRYSGILSRNRENACIANRQIIIKHFYTCNEYKEGLSFEDFFNNPEECFNSDLNCPAGGEYSLEGNYLVCSKHGKHLLI